MWFLGHRIVVPAAFVCLQPTHPTGETTVLKFLSVISDTYSGKDVLYIPTAGKFIDCAICSNNPSCPINAEDRDIKTPVCITFKELIKLGIGDSGRLQFIHETIQNGKKLYSSDKNYLNEKLNDTFTSIPETIEFEESHITEKEPTDSLKSELTQANTKIAKLESQLAESKSKLKDSKESQLETLSTQHTKKPGAMPKGWSLAEEGQKILQDKKEELALVSDKIKKEEVLRV